MQPSSDLLPPGVYPAAREAVPDGLSVSDTSVPGIVGLAQKGPLDVPMRVSSWQKYLSLFGEDTTFYMSAAVELFFRNGGSECYVVRVAHAARGGAQRGSEHATRAGLALNDAWQKPTVRFEAINEGAWGNAILVSIRHHTSESALLTRDYEVGSGELQLSSARNLAPGALIRIYNRVDESYAVVDSIDRNRVVLCSDTPVEMAFSAAAPSHVEVIRFDVEVAMKSQREVFKNLQMDPRSQKYLPSVLAAGSRLVRAIDLHSPSPGSHRLPPAMPLTRLDGGGDGSDAITPEDMIGWDNGPGDRTGLMALAAMDQVAILACPDAMLFCQRQPGPDGDRKAARVQEVMVSLCENLGDRFAILDCPDVRHIDAVRQWRRRTDSSYAAYYWPWLKHHSRSIPASAAMIGVYSHVTTESGAFTAPANVDIKDIKDIALHISEDDMGRLNTEGINTFRKFRGIRPWGARSASSDPDWRYINVRRLFIMLKRSFDSGFAWVPFEPNNQNLWESISRQATEFLTELQEKGALAGGNPDEGFYVKCDAETNSSDIVNEGKLICKVAVAPVVPAEFIIIEVVQDMAS